MYKVNPLLLEKSDNELDDTNRKHINLLSGGLATLIGDTAPALAAYPLSKTIDRGNSVRGTTVNNKLPESISKLKVNGNQNISDYMKKNGLSFSTASHPLGPHYNPISNTISLPVKEKIYG